MADEAKSQADQVGEITKLVEDAQDKLDQVVRALHTLRSNQLGQDREAGPDQHESAE
jgi:hypothetical protein